MRVIYNFFNKLCDNIFYVYIGQISVSAFAIKKNNLIGQTLSIPTSVKYYMKASYFDPHLPARCSGVEWRPCLSRQFTLSGVQSFLTRVKQPFLAASSSAASPLSRSWMSVSSSFTKSRGVFPSRFFLVGSAPCCVKELLCYTVVNIALNTVLPPSLCCHW